MKTKLFREQANHHLPWGVVDSSFLMTPVRWICSQIYALETKKPRTTCDRRSTGLTVQHNTVWPTWHVLRWGIHVAQYLAHDIASVITTCTEYHTAKWKTSTYALQGSPHGRSFHQVQLWMNINIMRTLFLSCGTWHPDTWHLKKKSI